jgi:hypothetical protein
MEWEKLLAEALHELYKAAEAARKETRPKTPLPKFRIWELEKGIFWPSQRYKEDPRYYWDTVEFSKGGSGDSVEINISWSTQQAAKIASSFLGYQPRRLLRCLRRIQAATAYCHRIREGRERAAAEILRQQQKAVEALEAEAALAVLKK